GQALARRRDVGAELLTERRDARGIALRLAGPTERADRVERLVDRSNHLDRRAVVPIVVRQRPDVDDLGRGAPVAVELDRIEADHEDDVARLDVAVEA